MAMSIFPTHMLTHSLASCVCKHKSFLLTLINIYTQFCLLRVLKSLKHHVKMDYGT
jgi:hypothetical protein